MGNIVIKGDAPESRKSLCHTCDFVHLVRGFGECEEVVVCRYTYPDMQMKFRVKECTGYLANNQATLKQMEDIAWIVDGSRSTRVKGFQVIEGGSSDGNGNENKNE